MRILAGFLLGAALAAYLLFAFVVASMLISVGLLLCVTVIGIPLGTPLILAGLGLLAAPFALRQGRR